MGDAFSVVVLPLPGSGPVYGGRVMDEPVKGGLLLTAQPLAPARLWALVPPITESAATCCPEALRSQALRPGRRVASVAGRRSRGRRLRGQAQEPGDLLDHRVVHQRAQRVAVAGARLQGTPVDDDRRPGSPRGGSARPNGMGSPVRSRGRRPAR